MIASDFILLIDFICISLKVSQVLTPYNKAKFKGIHLNSLTFFLVEFVQR